MTNDSPSSKATSAHVINSMFKSAPPPTLEEKIEAAKTELKEWHVYFCKKPNDPVIKNHFIELNINIAKLYINKDKENHKLEDLELVEKYLSAADKMAEWRNHFKYDISERLFWVEHEISFLKNSQNK